MSGLNSKPPCAACKFQRRKCTPECIFAPYFPPEQPQKFINVHKVYGASNVSKLLNDLPPNVRGDTVKSLVYEAETRLQQPLYGCVGVIVYLQERIQQLQDEIGNANTELSSYVNVNAPMQPPQPPIPSLSPIIQLQTPAFDQQYLNVNMGAGPSTRQYGVGTNSFGVNIGNQVEDVHRQQGLGLQVDDKLLVLETATNKDDVHAVMEDNN